MHFSENLQTFSSILLQSDQYDHEIIFWKRLLSLAYLKIVFSFIHLFYIPDNARLHSHCTNLNTENKKKSSLTKFPNSNN